MRDVMIVTIDPARAGDGEIDPSDGDRLSALAKRFSREDLMRSFDLLSTAEQEIRLSSQPRYYFEMMLLRWMHLRRLVPLTDLMEQLGGGAASARSALSAAPATRASAQAGKPAPSTARAAEPAKSAGDVPPQSSGARSLKDSLLAEIRANKAFFYNTVVAQAHKIDVVEGRVTFTFLAAHRALKEQVDQNRAWLESVAERVAGRKTAVVAVQAPADGSAAPPAAQTTPAQPGGRNEPEKRDLKAEAMSSSAMQAMLDVFPAEIRDVEEM
jgi:DNA polymerase-3 subunit gamma/tau